MTRARRLVVIVGQRKALFLAVCDWRRAARHTALGGLLDGTLRFDWNRGAIGPADNPADESAWEDLVRAPGRIWAAAPRTCS
jgi:hypothetical protein